MIGLLIPLVLSVSVQVPQGEARSTVASPASLGSNAILTPAGRRPSARLDFGLGLGTGGIGVRRPTEAGRGFLVTPRGIRIRAKRVGVRIDFVGGGKLMITNDGRLHLRSGEKTLPFLRGVRLAFRDGTILTVKRSGSPKQPLSSVTVEVDGKTRSIWSGSRRVVNASHTAPFGGATILACGNGTTLYRADRAGPILALDRVLCPSSTEASSPRKRVIVLGEVLARSMQLLPKHAPRHSIQFPQVAEAAQRFAALGGVLFQRAVPRPKGSLGEIWFELAGDYRVKVDTGKNSMMTIGLYRRGSETPGVEWLVGFKTTVHFVRPLGGAQGGPRYFMRGIDVSKIVADAAPFASLPAQRRRVAKTVEALGGRPSRALRVRAR